MIKNIFSFSVSSDLFVPFLAGRALHEVRALQDGVLPHPVLDADDRLLQTLLLVQFRLFLGFLFLQRLVIGEKVRLVGIRIGRDVVLADDVVRHDRDSPDQRFGSTQRSNSPIIASVMIRRDDVKRSRLTEPCASFGTGLP